LSERHNGAPAALASLEQGTFTPWGPPAGGSSPFVLPYGVAVDPAGDIYVADPGSNRIEKLSPTGQPLAEYGGTARGSIRLNGPSGVAVDSRGDVYVADTGNDRILKLLPDGGMAVVWEGNLIPRTGLVVNNPLSRPLGVAVDRRGDIYAANTGGNTIASISSDGMSNAGVSAGLAGLNAPGGLAVDSRGAIYVADTGNHRIEKLSPSGSMTCSSPQRDAKRRA
jgi:sugar lactone lactonase YvrE